MRRERGSGSLRLRGATWWARYYHAGKLIEESTGEREERKARTVLRQKVKAADTPQFLASQARKLTFEDVIALADRDAARKGNRTAGKIGYRVAHLAETFAGWPALAITTDAVDTYTDARLAAGAQPATVNRELAQLRRGFRLAVQKGMLPTMPHMTVRREDNVRQGFIDPAEFEAFLDDLRQRDAVVADVADCAFSTCLRRGNVLALTWPLFVLEFEAGHVVAGSLRLPGSATKNKRPLALPLTGRLLALIDRRWHHRVRTCDYVFHHDGARVLRFDRLWHAAAAAIGRPGLLLHDLRRSGARALRRAGVAEDVIMKLGGWRTRAMFSRYNIVDESDLADAQVKLNAAFAEARRSVVPLRRKA
jgi:integrase